MNKLDKSWQEKAENDYDKFAQDDMGYEDYLQGATDYMAAVENKLNDKKIN